MSDHLDIKTNGFRCLRCGAEETLVMPLSLEAFVAAGKAFEQTHRQCRESHSHVVMECDTIRCQRCGASERLSPAPAAQFTAAIGRFVGQHLGCPAPNTENAAPPGLWCSECGRKFDPNQLTNERGLIPYHDYPRPLRQVCRGSMRDPAYAPPGMEGGTGDA